MLQKAGLKGAYITREASLHRTSASKEPLAGSPNSRRFDTALNRGGSLQGRRRAFVALPSLAAHKRRPGTRLDSGQHAKSTHTCQMEAATPSENPSTQKGRG
ncbi:hypothetical protein MRX96_033674 [Rhipicephalus microplus]